MTLSLAKAFLPPLNLPMSSLSSCRVITGIGSGLRSSRKMVGLGSDTTRLVSYSVGDGRGAGAAFRMPGLAECVSGVLRCLL